jgi:hypothetical protein
MMQPSLFERTTTGRTEREKRKSSSFFVIPFAEGVAPVAARQTYLRLRCGEELLRNRKHYADCQKVNNFTFRLSAQHFATLLLFSASQSSVCSRLLRTFDPLEYFWI